VDQVGVLSEASIRDRLDVGRVGRVMRMLPETTSTNDEALAAVGDASADGLVVFAEHQTAGRGRLGRHWVAPRGASLLCTALVFLDDDPAWQCRTTLIGALATCEAARTGGADTAEIKWPNDVVVGEKKVGGVLVESRAGGPSSRAYAIGVGINCLQQPGHWPEDLRDRATSLEIESAHAVDRAAVARTLLTVFDRWFATPRTWDDEALKQAWLHRARPLGARVRLLCDRREFTGSVIDIDPSAGLIVELDGGGRRHFDPARTAVL